MSESTCHDSGRSPICAQPGLGGLRDLFCLSKTQILIGACRPGLLCGSDSGCHAVSVSLPARPELPFSTRTPPQTCQPRSNHRRVIEAVRLFSCVDEHWAGDGLRPLTWLCALPTFAISHPLGFRISQRQRRLAGHMVGVVHFWTQKGTHGQRNRGIIIGAIGTQNGMQSDSREGANIAFFVTGRAE